MAIATAVGLAGPGTISLDQLLGINLPYPLLFIILALVGVLVDIVGLVMTRPASSARTPPSAAS